MTQPELMKLFKMIDIDYPANKLGQDKELQDMTVARWLQKLGQYDAVRVYAAYEAHVKRSPTFAPNWQHLVAILDEYTTQSESAESAWGRLQQAVRKYGHTEKQQAALAIPDIWPLVDRWGWDHWCQMAVEDAAVYYSQFRNAYEVDSKRTTERARLSPGVVAALDGMKRLEDGR